MSKLVSEFDVTVTVPEGAQPGDEFVVHVTTPVVEGQSRGQLKGIDLKDMTDDQLKIETINANSVLYKAKKRGASAETIAAAEARVAAVKAEKESRKATTVETSEEEQEAADNAEM